jgi:hypothetical protein
VTSSGTNRSAIHYA